MKAGGVVRNEEKGLIAGRTYNPLGLIILNYHCWYYCRRRCLSLGRILLADHQQSDLNH